jgi:hypothetical protein
MEPGTMLHSRASPAGAELHCGTVVGGGYTAGRRRLQTHPRDKENGRMSRQQQTWMTGAIVLHLALVAGAADWPHFRGPDYNGVAHEQEWQPAFAEPEATIAWRTDVGVGAASVVVVGERMVTTGNRKDKDVVVCLNPADGSEHWRFSYPCKFERRQFEGGTASTPTIAGDRVYTLSHDGQLFCLDLSDGSKIWEASLPRDYNGQPSRWKYAGSPLLQDGMLILDAGGTGNSTLALKPADGSKVWGAGNDPAGYASPIPFRQGDRAAVLVFKGTHLSAIALADGERLWNYPWKTAYDVNASSPTALPGSRVLVSSGYGGGRAALLDASTGQPEQVWLNEDMKTKMSSCVVVGDYVFGVAEAGGRLLCLDLATGKEQWSKDGMTRYGTLVATPDHLIVLTERGELVVAEASGDAYRERARARVLEGRCWVQPVLANGRIYCRNNTGGLVCVDARP